jgi:hypothetical protein
MAKLLKLGLVLLAALAIFALPAYAITSATIVDASGNVVSLKYDNVSNSYIDSGINNNTFLSVCNVTANNYVGYVYKANNTYVQINSGIGGPFGNLLRILSVNASNCSKIDLDFSTTSAYYPGIPTVVYSADNTLSSDDNFTQLSQSDGWLKGNFTVSYADSGTNSLDVSVNNVYDDTGSAITEVRQFIILAIKDGSGNITGSSIVRPGQHVTFTKPSNFTFFVNGLDLNGSLTYYCGNSVCESSLGENTANCPADCAAPIPTGAAFGNVTTSEWPCTWVSTYDGSATPAQPIKLLYYHECTPLREVDIAVSKLVIGARIKTYGNESVVNPPSRPAGTTLGYFKFEHNIPEDSFSNVLMQYKVSKAELAQKGFATEGVSLQKLTDSGWVKLPTKLVSEDSNYFFFESTASSLSLFAIVAEKVAPVAVPITPPAVVPTQPVVETKFQFPVLFVTLFILMIIIMTLGFRYSAHRARTTTIPAYKAPKIPHIRIPEMPSIPKISAARAQLPAALVNLQERIERIKQEAEITTQKLEAKQESQESTVLEEPKAKKLKKIPKVHRKRAKRISKKAFEDVEKALK